MSTENKLYTKHIVGYSDEISVRPGGKISFMVSSEDNAEYDASFVRIIHGDTNPEGPGYKVESVNSEIDGRYKGKRQECLGGSFVAVPNSLALEELDIEVVERPISRSELYLCDEVFLTGTAAHIQAVGAIDFRKVGSGSAGPLTKKLQELYFDIVRGKSSKYVHQCTTAIPKVVA